MSITDQEMMTISEMAGYLRISEKAVTRLAEMQGLPVDKDSEQWIFEKAAVDNWVTSRVQAASNDSLVSVLKTKKKLIPLPRLVSLDRMVLDIEPGSKQDVLSQLVAPLAETRAVKDPASFLQRLLEREGMLSTALCDGVAMPHVRDHETSGIESPCVILGICNRGTDFGSLDGEPTTLFFLPCSPDTATHLRLLAKLTMLLRQHNMPERLRLCRTKDCVMGNLIAAHLEMSIEM